MKYTNILLGLLCIIIGFLIFFIRSPDRKNHKYEQNFIYSPTDGLVMNIVDLDKDMIRIIYYLNLLNNHTQYIPIDSKVLSKKGYAGTGSNYIAYDPNVDKNSNVETILQSTTHGFTYKITQRTGIIARRILNYTEQLNDLQLKVGDKLGFIMFGSRVDIDIPKNVIKQILIKKGDNIKGIKKIIELKKL